MSFLNRVKLIFVSYLVYVSEGEPLTSPDLSTSAASTEPDLLVLKWTAGMEGSCTDLVLCPSKTPFLPTNLLETIFILYYFLTLHVGNP